MTEHVQIHPYYNLAYGAVEIRVSRLENNKRLILSSSGWEPLEDGSFTAPTFMMNAGAAQELACRLWDAGFRPEQSKQSQGAYDARGNHLSDMRAIVFAKLNIERPS